MVVSPDQPSAGRRVSGSTLRTPGVSATCMATSSSGVATGITPNCPAASTPICPKSVERQMATGATRECAAAAPGATTECSAVLACGSATSPNGAPITSAFASPSSAERRRRNSPAARRWLTDLLATRQPRARVHADRVTGRIHDQRDCAGTVGKVEGESRYHLPAECSCSLATRREIADLNVDDTV